MIVLLFLLVACQPPAEPTSTPASTNTPFSTQQGSATPAQTRTWIPFPTPTQEIADCSLTTETLTVQVNTLNARDEPTTNSQRVGGYSFGQSVTVTTCEPVTASGFVWRQTTDERWRGAWVASGPVGDADGYLR